MREEICTPSPEPFIKSMAEQGYTLETSIADLIDNSISAGAGKIEILVDTQHPPFRLFIADDGCGMFPEELKRNMLFPSCSIDDKRKAEDLGRFGLGLKTASFAQTRSFTVISKKSGTNKYHARTWDVEHLKSGTWSIIINTEAEIKEYLNLYTLLSKGFLNAFEKYIPNTIVIWHHLYKFQHEYTLSDNSRFLQKELTETTREYLQLVFHRFLERDTPLKIRLNNEQLKPFNPFPSKARSIAAHHKTLMENKLRLEGFVLPSKSLEESKGVSEWTLSHKSLTDMEGIYVYRADRIIVCGGWNGLIKKAPRLRLARLKVEIGNGIDHLFHLNVAKSSISIPFGERVAFIKYVIELKKEAEKEFYNYTTRVGSGKSQAKEIFTKIPTSQGLQLKIDYEFPVLKMLTDTLTEDQKKNLKIILRLVTATVNKIKKVGSDEDFTGVIEKDGLSECDIKNSIQQFLANGISKQYILNELFREMGIDAKTLPQEILLMLK